MAVSLKDVARREKMGLPERLQIISTLFLIWFHTRNQPSIVLIDEPELHLNAEWRRDFIQQVYQLAPNNQYIIATHSGNIFRSVDEDRRLILEQSPGLPKNAESDRVQ